MKDNIRQNITIINGLRVSYTITSGKEPALLFLHGWTCNSTFWNNQIEAFKGNHKIIAVDFRGHGESQITAEGNTVQQLADDVYSLVCYLGLQNFVIIGHSMGGMVAQQFCVDHLECVKALVLVTTIASDLENKLISKKIEAETQKVGYRNAFLKYFYGWMNPDTDPKIIEWTMDEMLNVPDDVANSLVRSYRSFNLTNHLPEFQVPSLVVGAGLDTSAVPKETKTIAALLPQSKLVMIENCGHFPMLEKPERLNHELNKFLVSLP